MKTKLTIAIVAIITISTTYFTANRELSQVKAVYEQRSENNTAIPASWRGAQEWYQSVRSNVNTGKVELSDNLRARAEVDAIPKFKSGAVGLQWTELGPNNVGGRTRAILVDKEDATSKTIYAGSVSGGLFKSTDGAANWSPVNDLDQNLIISSIAQDANGDIYVATGSSVFERGFDFAGRGIAKLTKSTGTWSWLASTDPINNGCATDTFSSGCDWATIPRIACHPTKSGEIYAGTNDGFHVSTDGGMTWTKPQYVSCPNDGSGIGVVPSPAIEQTGTIQEIRVNSNGRVFIAYGSAVVYYTDSPTQICSWIKVSGNGDLPGSSGRAVIAPAASDPNYVYVMLSGGDNTLTGVYKSTDGGDDWTEILTKIDNGTLANNCDHYFVPLSNTNGDCSLQGQGDYDLALEVFKNDKNSILIGGTQTWKFDGSLTRVALEYGGQFNPFYLHADKHQFHFDPNDAGGSNLFVASDGGVTASYDGGQTWVASNRGYNVTQFYSVGFDSKGTVIGGTQDNGTNVVDPSVGMGTTEVKGGDGFDCDISSINDVTFASLYYGQIDRADKWDGSYSGVLIGENGPFNTVFRMWESAYDVTSKDSMIFVNEEVQTTLAVGNGIAKSFNKTLANVAQPNANIGVDNNTLVIQAGGVILTNAANNTVLAGNGGSGTFNPTNNKVDITFTTAPAANTPIKATFDATYLAGSDLQLTSNSRVIVTHTLTSNLLHDDTLKVQDQIQSLAAVSRAGFTQIARYALALDTIMSFYPIPAIGGTASAIEFSKDGNHMFVGTTGGAVYRVSGLNNFYTNADLTNGNVVVTQIHNGPSQVGGIAVDYNNPDNIVVTHTNYGTNDHVYLFTNATTVTTTGTGTSVQGTGMPDFPVYDACFNVQDPSQVVLGTEFGVWATDDIYASTVTWSEENTGMAHTPVFAVRQQKLAWDSWPIKPKNNGVFYLGTHGRGFYKSDTYLGTKDDKGIKTNFEASLKVYPNPMNSEGFISFELADHQQGSITVLDLQGKVLLRETGVAFNAGANTIPLDNTKLPSGTYFVAVEAGEFNGVTRFVLMK